jgi:hypothetical protein
MGRGLERHPGTRSTDTTQVVAAPFTEDAPFLYEGLAG